MRGASMAVNSTTKNTKNMLLRRKYCSNDNTNPKRPSQREFDMKITMSWTV